MVEGGSRTSAATPTALTLRIYTHQLLCLLLYRSSIVFRHLQRVYYVLQALRHISPSIAFELVLFATAVKERHLLLSTFCDGFLAAGLRNTQP